MKKILFILGTLFSISGFGQIVLDSSDFFGVGDTFTVVEGSNPSIINVSGGANHTWDFSGLKVSSLAGSKVRAIDPIKHIEDTLFPNADMFITGSSYANSYLIKTADSLVLDGSANIELIQGNFFDLNFDPNIKILDFPINYLNSVSSVTNIDTIIDTTIIAFDKVRIEVQFGMVSDVEGWGKVKTVQGTYDALKVYTMQAQGFDVYGHIPVIGWQSSAFLTERDTAHIYRWFGKGHDYQIAEAETDSRNGVATKVSFLLTDSLLAYISDSINPTCYGFSDGQASVEAVGGTGNYTYKWDNAGSGQGKTITNLNSRIYNVTVTDIVSNKTSEAQVSITDPDSLDLYVISMKDEGPTPGTGEIEIGVNGGTSPYTYGWDKSSSTDKIASDLTGGNHTVTVTDKNNCVKDTNLTIGSTVGIDAYNNQNRVLVYPNPVSQSLTVESLEGDSHVDIYNMLGNKVYQGTGNESSQIDMSSFENGIYILKITNSNSTQNTVRVEKK
ncbi:MAG: T9SS type A sorting domain-containing protein [Salibacteraceae bacterium]